MTSDFEIRPFRDGDEDGVLTLFNAVFSEGNPTFTPRSMAHWRWQFANNPRSHHSYVAVDEEGSIIGSYTSIPGMWRHHGEPLPGSQAVDTCVDAAYRRVLKRKGLFLTLARTWFDHYGVPERDQIVYGFPNPIAFRIGTKRLDYRPVHTPVRALVRDFQDDWIDYLGPMGGDAVEVTLEEDFPEDVGDLFERTMGDLPLVQVRDLEYLRWRYRDCPSFDYRILVARAGGTLRGVLVLRTEWFDKPLAPLVDWIVDGGDQEAICGLVQASARMAKEDGKSRIETWLPLWSNHGQTLKTIGFAEDPSTFHQCIRVFGPRFDEKWAAENWFTTMGDSDVY